MKVAGFGEIMLRLSTDVGKMILQSDSFNVNYGGGEANVLISLSHFGIDTKMITSVSNDDIGKSILRYLRSYDIDTDFVTLGEHRTGIYYLQVGSGIRSSKVIYDRDNSAFCNMKRGDIDIAKALEDVEAAMKGLLDPIYEEKVIGNALVRQTFKVSGVGTIAGCFVTDGKIERNAGVRVIRDSVVIHEGKLVSLKRFKDDVKEVTKGFECGCQIENYNDLKENDVIEFFVMEEVKR